MGLQDQLGELTAFIQAMLNDSGDPDAMMPNLSDAEKYFPTNHSQKMLSEAWALGEAGTRAWGGAMSLCLDDPQVQATAIRNQVEAVVRECLVSGLDEDQPVPAIADEIRSRLLSGSEIRRVFLPLTNLIVDMAPVPVGRVTLLPKDHDICIERCATIAETWGDDWEGILDKRVSPSAFAEVEVEALPGCAVEVAEFHVEEPRAEHIPDDRVGVNQVADEGFVLTQEPGDVVRVVLEVEFGHHRDARPSIQWA